MSYSLLAAPPAREDFRSRTAKAGSCLLAKAFAFCSGPAQPPWDVGEKSVMHSHPDSVAVFLEDQKAKMTHPDGKSEEMSGKKGEAMFTPAGAHLPENIGTGPIDVILVELKKPAAK